MADSFLILMLVAVLRTPSIHSPSKFLLCSLTLSDLLVGVVVQSLYLAAFFERNHSVLNASRTMSFIASGASLFTMTATAGDRFLALHLHLLYAALMTTSHYKSLTIGDPQDCCRHVIKLRFPDNVRTKKSNRKNRAICPKRRQEIVYL